MERCHIFLKCGIMNPQKKEEEQTIYGARNSGAVLILRKEKGYTMSMETDSKKQFQKILEESNYIVFFSGAGVSTESNIPDFRSESGIYQTVKDYGYPPEVMLSHSFFLRHTKAFFAFYKDKMIYRDAKPNNAHYFAAEYEKRGKVKAVITQNIDGLHQMAGSQKVLELHGSVLRNYCMNCNRFYSLEEVLSQEKEIPVCETCGGIIKPDVVLYEESLDEQTLMESVMHLEKADTLIVGGTSLTVYPAAGLLRYFRGKNLVLINKSKTDYDNMADLVIRENIGQFLGQFLD